MESTVMESTREALSGMASLYGHWQDILDTADELEAFSGRAFDHVTGSAFLAQWQREMADAVGAVKRLDVSSIEETLQQQIANLVAQAGGILSQAIPDDVETLMNSVKNYIPTDVPHRDKIIAAANLVRNNVSVNVRPHVPAAATATSPSSGGASATPTSGNPSTSGAANVEPSNSLADYLIDAFLPEFEQYEGNVRSLFDRMQDILEVSNIQVVLEAEMAPIAAMLTSRRTATGDPLTMKDLIGEVPRLIGRLMKRALALVEDFMRLVFEAVATMARILKTVRDKLNPGSSSWPDSPLKSFVQQLGLENMPGPATLPALLISMLLVPVYKAATGERPHVFASIFQSEEDMDKCDKASASLGLISTVAGIALQAYGMMDPPKETDPPKVTYELEWLLGTCELTIALFGQAFPYVYDDEGGEEDEKSALERHIHNINWVKDVVLPGIVWLADAAIYGYSTWHFRYLTTNPNSHPNWKDDWETKRRANREAYRDSLSWYNGWFSFGTAFISFALEVTNLGLSGRIIALERQEDISYDVREHASMMLGPSLTLVDGIVGFYGWYNDANKTQRSLKIGGKIGTSGQTLTAILRDELGPVNKVRYFWSVNGSLTATNDPTYTQAAADEKINLVAIYTDLGGDTRILRAEPSNGSLIIRGIPKAGVELSTYTKDAIQPKPNTTPSYQWYKGSPSKRVLIGDKDKYTIQFSPDVRHGDSIFAEMTYTPDNATASVTMTSCPMTIMNSTGKLSIAGAAQDEITVGKTLTASIADADGVDDTKKKTFVWKVEQVILSASGHEYTVKFGPNKAAGEVLHKDSITVEATYTDLGGTTETIKLDKPIKVVDTEGKFECASAGNPREMKLTDADGIIDASVAWTDSAGNQVTVALAQIGADVTTFTGEIDLTPLAVGETILTVTYHDKGSPNDVRTLTCKTEKTA